MNKKVFKTVNTNHYYMKKVKYDHLFVSTWKLMIKNMVIFVPKIIMMGISMFLFVLYLGGSGILWLLIKNPAMIYDQVVLHEQIRSFVGSHIIWSIASLAGYLVLVMLTDLFFITMKYGMIKDVILRKKPSLKEGFRFAKKYYSTSLFIHIASFLLVYSPLIIIGIIFYKIATKTNSFALMTPWVIVAIFLLLVFIYVAYMLVRMIFVYPVMAFEETGALKSIKKDFHYVKTHVGHTIITWMLFLVVWFVFMVLKTPLGNVGNKANNLLLIIGATLLVMLLSGVVSVWEHLFIFKSYFEGKVPEKRKLFKEDNSWKEMYK